MEILLFIFVALHSEGIITKEHSSNLVFPLKHTYKACFDEGFVYHLGLHLVLQVEVHIEAAQLRVFRILQTIRKKNIGKITFLKI